MRDDRGVAGAAGDGRGVESLGERADLVDLQQDRVADAGPDPLAQQGGVGAEHVVADELAAVSDSSGQPGPPGPIVLGERIFQRHDRIRVEQAQQVVDVLVDSSDGVVGAVVVGAVDVELRRGRVQQQDDVRAGLVAGPFDRGHDAVEGLSAERRSGAKPRSSPTLVFSPAAARSSFRVWNTSERGRS